MQLLPVSLLLLWATDPTFLRRHVPEVAVNPQGYKAIFGAGDADAKALRVFTAIGELTIGPSGPPHRAISANAETIYVVLDGSGSVAAGAERVPLKRFDYFYIAPGVEHTLSATGSPLRAMVMSARTTAGAPAPPKIPIANIEDVPTQQVGGHPPSTLYRLLLGTTASTRDRLAVAQSITSLFVMEFAAGGTNIPHHHETEEEVYFVMDGEGQMVAGGGMDGLEGKHASRAGDAWFFRLNTTVGFYAGPKSRILAVRVKR